MAPADKFMRLNERRTQSALPLAAPRILLSTAVRPRDAGGAVVSPRSGDG